MGLGGEGGRGEKSNLLAVPGTLNICDQDTVKFRVVTFGLCSLWDWLFPGKPSFRWLVTFWEKNCVYKIHENGC